MERYRYKASFFEHTLKKNPVIWSAICGLVAGLFLLIPYTILAYLLFTFIETGEMSLRGAIAIEGPRALRFFFVSISLSFIIFGGIIGYVFGKWYERKQLHINEQIEREKKEAAIETLRELNVTLSHYIINSSSIIKGFSKRGIRAAQDDKIKEYFSIILEEVDRTIAVIKGLSDLKEIETVKYIESGMTMMIDLKKQIEEQLEKLQLINNQETIE